VGDEQELEPADVVDARGWGRAGVGLGVVGQSRASVRGRGWQLQDRWMS
jgi:hypothetical protein